MSSSISERSTYITAAVTMARLAFKLPGRTGPVPVKSIVMAGLAFAHLTPALSRQGTGDRWSRRARRASRQRDAAIGVPSSRWSMNSRRPGGRSPAPAASFARPPLNVPHVRLDHRPAVALDQAEQVARPAGLRRPARRRRPGCRQPSESDAARRAASNRSSSTVTGRRRPA